MDTAGLINSSLDGIPILPREPPLLFASGASSLCGSLIGSEELQSEKSSCSFRQTSNNLFLLFSIYVCMYTLFYTTHKRRRCIYLLSCFSSSFSISLSVYVNSRKHFAPRCGDYITARATVKIHQRWLYISLSVLHVARFATLGISRTITDGTADRESTSQRTRRVDVWYGLPRGNTVHEERLLHATAVNTTMTHDDATGRMVRVCRLSVAECRDRDDRCASKGVFTRARRWLDNLWTPN